MFPVRNNTKLKEKIVWVIVALLLYLMGWFYDYNNEKSKAPAAETTAEADKISDQVIDKRDGKTYKTVKIGSQVWMAENLAYKPSSGNYWAYDDDNSNVAKYGYLYDWETAKKVCPVGWYLPSDEEWATLTDYLGGENVAGTKMKSTSGWNNNAINTNESGFSGLQGGSRSSNGNYYSIGDFGTWWSSTQSITYNAWGRNLYCNTSAVGRSYYYKGSGLSVRCLRD